jgi:hypothetical protein
MAQPIADSPTGDKIIMSRMIAGDKKCTQTSRYWLAFKLMIPEFISLDCAYIKLRGL